MVSPAEPAILCEVRRKFVAQAEEHRIAAVPHLHQLGWKRAVIGPESQRPLVRQIGMKTWMERNGRIDAGIEIRGNTWIVNGVDLGPLHGGGNCHLDRKSTRLNSSHVSESRMP